MALVLVGFFVALTALAVIRPHYRRIRPLYRAYAHDVWRSIRGRERIVVGARLRTGCTLDTVDR